MKTNKFIIPSLDFEEVSTTTRTTRKPCKADIRLDPGDEPIIADSGDEPTVVSTTITRKPYPRRRPRLPNPAQSSTISSRRIIPSRKFQPQQQQQPSTSASKPKPKPKPKPKLKPRFLQYEPLIESSLCGIAPSLALRLIRQQLQNHLYHPPSTSRAGYPYSKHKAN